MGDSDKHTEIQISFPDAADRHLRLRVGACRLRLTPGAGDAWVSGTYDDPTGSMLCQIRQDGGTAQITQKPQISSVGGWRHGTPEFNLRLGAGRPYGLSIETGASDSDFELGGLPLTRLVAKAGAGKVVLRFAEPNPQQMSLLDFDAGAGVVEMHNLAQANFAEMRLDGGAAAFICDFGGTLQRGASVRISTTMGSLDLSVPAGTAARINPEFTMGQLNASDGFTTREGGYWRRRQ